jgi:hypothetical protein
VRERLRARLAMALSRAGSGPKATAGATTFRSRRRLNRSPPTNRSLPRRPKGRGRPRCRSWVRFDSWSPRPREGWTAGSLMRSRCVPGPGNFALKPRRYGSGRLIFCRIPGGSWTRSKSPAGRRSSKCRASSKEKTSGRVGSTVACASVLCSDNEDHFSWRWERTSAQDGSISMPTCRRRCPPY